jgi:hypothetical protein
MKRGRIFVLGVQRRRDGVEVREVLAFIGGYHRGGSNWLKLKGKRKKIIPTNTNPNAQKPMLRVGTKKT